MKSSDFNTSTKKYLRMDISLQKSSMFSAVRSCSRKTLTATSVPFHMPRKTSPKKPIHGKYNKSQLNGVFIKKKWESYAEINIVSCFENRLECIAICDTV